MQWSFELLFREKEGERRIERKAHFKTSSQMTLRKTSDEDPVK